MKPSFGFFIILLLLTLISAFYLQLNSDGPWKSPFRPSDVLPLLPSSVSWPILRSLYSAVDILPTFVGLVSSPETKIEWKGACFYNNTAWMEFHNKSKSPYGGGTLHIKVKNAHSWTCMDLYVFATPYRVTWDYYFLSREHTLEFDEWEGEEEYEYVKYHGVSIFLMQSGMLGTLRALWDVFPLFTNTGWGENSNLAFLRKHMGAKLEERPEPWVSNISVDDVHSGDFLALSKIRGRWGGFETLEKWVSGSYVGHSAVCLKDSEGKLWVAESGNENDKGEDVIAILPWEEWWDFELNKDDSNPQIALLPLHPDVRARLNSTAAWEYARSMDGKPYGYHNMIFSWIDTPKDNYPPPIDANLVASGMIMWSKIQPAYASNMWNEALNKRIGTEQMESFSDCAVTFKYGGHWVVVKNENRRRYQDWKQKTVKLTKDCINIQSLCEIARSICPWIHGHDFEIRYHVCGTSPKEFMLLVSDDDARYMIEQMQGNQQEIVISTQNEMEDETECQSQEILRNHQIVECSDAVTSTISIGEVFIDSMAFKQAIRTHAITHNFGIKIKASDKKRVIAICSHRGCTWRIRGSLCADGHSFEVKKLDGTHLCPGINRAGNKIATSSWIASHIEGIVKKQPDVPPKIIKNNLETTFGLSLPYMKLWRSRELAREMVSGSVDENYRWVPMLKAELQKRNPGSHITYTYDSADNSFKRFYCSFRVCIEGFLAGCRPLIGIDACHLKSKYLGVLLSANTLDGNNGLFTLAFAVAENESFKTWQWFLQNLYDSIGFDMYPLAFISDMEKGLAKAMKEIFPNAEHRVCLRHLWKNVRKFFSCSEGNQLQSLVWSAANAISTYEFERKMIEIYNVRPLVHSYLISLDYKWSVSQFMLDIKHNSNTNNMSESFNAWISEARSKPVVDLIDFIRGMLMDQRASRWLNSVNWRNEIVPQAEDYIREITRRKDQFIIRKSTATTAEVEGIHERHAIDIELKECTCKTWQLTGLPCIHAVAFIGMMEHPLWHIYVSDYFHVYRYKMAYEGPISTLPSKEQWDTVTDDVGITVPNTSRPRGRPRKSRLKSFVEDMKKIHKCSRCGLRGHYKNTCKNPLGESVGGVHLNLNSQ